MIAERHPVEHGRRGDAQYHERGLKRQPGTRAAHLVEQAAAKTDGLGVVAQDLYVHEDDDGERKEELGNGGPLGEESYRHARDVV